MFSDLTFDFLSLFKLSSLDNDLLYKHIVAPISVVVCVYILNDVPAIAVAAPTVATIVFATVVVAYVVNDVAAVAAVMTIFIPLLFPISGLLLTLLRLLLSR